MPSDKKRRRIHDLQCAWCGKDIRMDKDDVTDVYSGDGEVYKVLRTCAGAMQDKLDQDFCDMEDKTREEDREAK